MKIRKGFVGNCSSSSFVVERDAYPNVFALAKHMLAIRNNDGDWDTKEVDKINLAELADLDRDTPVTFSTCNYDTFITPTNNGYYVSTCNNTSWEEIRGQRENGGGHDEGDYYDLERSTKYWHVAEGLIGTPISYDEAAALKQAGKLPGTHCPTHCQGYVRLLDGELVCPECYAQGHGKDMLLVKKAPPKVKAIKIPKALRFR